MDQTNHSDYIFKSRPGYAAICTGVIGLVFFGSITSYFLNKKWLSNGDQKTENIIVLVIGSVFLFFAIASLWMLLNIKIITLTNSELIIRRPLLFLHKSIPLIQITSISQSDDPVEISQNFRTTSIYTGNKTILQLINGDKIKFNSMEIGGYKVLIKQMVQALGKIKRNY